MSAGTSFDRTVARLLVEQQRREGSGILKASRNKLRRLFCLEGGRLVHAASNLIEEQLAETLKSKGLLSPPVEAALREEASSNRGSGSSDLLQRGLVPETLFRSALEERIEQLLFRTMDWPDGAVEFLPGKPNLEGEVTVSLAPVSVVLLYPFRHVRDLDLLRRRIGSPAVRFERAPVLEPEALDPLARFLLDRCDGGKTAAELLSSAPEREPEALRALYGLLLAGLLEPAGEVPSRRYGREGELPLTREECLARLASAEGGDAWAVLGLERSAPPVKIREAYYAIARRYHPDRFRTGPLQDLLPRFERFFTAVTEAYNTLSNPESRAEYERRAAIGAEGGASRAADTATIARQNFLRGRALAERKRWAEATAFLENAVQLDPDHADYRLELGHLLARNPRRRTEAESHLKLAAELEPAKPAPHVALAYLFRLQSRWAEAFHAAREALRWDPENEEARALLLELREMARQPGADEALGALFRH